MNVIAVLMFSVLLQASASADSIVQEAIVNAPVNQVWDAFTTKGGIESWMAVSGDVDPRVGGKMRVTHRKGADLDGETAIHQTILSVDPQRMLSFRTVKSPEGFPFAATIGRTWTVIYFDALDANRTRVTAKMLGYGSDPELQKMRAFFEVGNKATLDALVKRFASR
ncbi:MAG: SRPBCC family protein [Vicinamibacterales bacterium]